jgi:predicted NAD-dependent protein-ADP-ribosyltransferase YbiA (DUF1768 family)
MKVRVKNNLLIVTAETPEEQVAVAAWAAGMNGHVFSLTHQDERTFRLANLGPRADACREPINIISRSPDPAVKLISNLAHTPFELDGLDYGSVEAFWQGLKFPENARRREIAPLFGHEARRAGFDAPKDDTVKYQGKTIRVGTADHWQLMVAACWAKFNQHEAARKALLETKERPLMHRTKHDSRNIPGAIMADIWMRVRRGLVKRLPRGDMKGEVAGKDD